MNRFSLKYRIALLAFAIMGVTISGMLWQVHRMQNNSIVTEQAADEAVIVNMLGEISRFSLINSEFADLEHYFNVVSRNPHIVKIVLADTANRIVASTEAALLGRTLPELANSNTTIWRTASLTNAAGAQGLLAVEFSNAQMIADQNRIAAWSVMAGLVSMTLVALFSFMMGTAITRRLSVLDQATKRIGEGDFRTRIEIAGSDEVAMLGKTIDGMAQKIETTLEVLKASEQRFTSAFDHAPIGMALVSLDERFIQVNQSLCRILGHPKEKLLSMTVTDITHPDDRAAEEEYKKAVREGGKSDFRMIKRYLHADGHIVWGQLNVSLMTDSRDRPEYFIGQLEDITARKLALEEQRKLISIIETSADLIGIADLEGNLLYLNTAGLRLVGLDDLDNVRKRSVRQFHLEDDYRKFETEIMPAIMQNGRWTGETAYRHFVTGLPVPVEMSGFLIRDQDNGQPVALGNISRDIRERRRAEAERQNLQSQLMQAQKMEAVGQLAGGIAHDFNNILTAIIGFANLALVKLQADHPVRSYVEQMLVSAERAASLTRNLLTFSRRQTIDPRPVTVNSIVDRVEKLLLRIIGEDIVLRVLMTHEDTTVLADAIQIEHILLNLATNARDAMPEGGQLTIETARAEMNDEYVSACEFGKAGTYVLISVTDTGSGMDEKTQQRAFEPFFTTKEVGKGTGLGMAMVYGSVKQHDGYISVYSEPGVGTTFKIYLPFHRSEAVLPPLPESVSALEGGTETILLAEDDEAIRVLVSSLLKEAGYNVITAVDGQDAVASFIRHADSISLLLLDVIMPGKNGRQVYEAARELNPSIKALFVSGYTADVIEKKGVLDEGLAFLSKPVSPADLLRKVRNVLDCQEMEQPGV